MAELTSNTDGAERREAAQRPPGALPVRGVVALSVGGVMLIANLLWILSLMSTVLAGEGSRQLLGFVGIPAVLCLVAVVLIDFGLGRLRGTLSWLDRRRGL